MWHCTCYRVEWQYIIGNESIYRLTLCIRHRRNACHLGDSLFFQARARLFRPFFFTATGSEKIPQRATAITDITSLRNFRLFSPSKKFPEESTTEYAVLWESAEYGILRVRVEIEETKEGRKERRERKVIFSKMTEINWKNVITLTLKIIMLLWW